MHAKLTNDRTGHHTMLHKFAGIVDETIPRLLIFFQIYVTHVW